MEYVLETNALCKSYGNFKALNNLTMRIPKGSIYGFVGKNGAGKTTLIRLICGLLRPNSGEYLLYGKKYNDPEIGKSRCRTGAVVENPSIYMDMTAMGNLKQQALLLGLPSFQELSDILALVGLQDTGRKKVRAFSLGMRQRLGIAIALVGNPDFLILDEPTNGLDPQGIVEIRELILKLNRERQVTILISSHILDELSRLATHYGFVDKGHLLKELTASELDEACRKCMRATVSNVTALVRVLYSMQVSYKILSETAADIYADIPVSRLALALDKENCEILSLQEHDENLEGYYMELMGGADHE